MRQAELFDAAHSLKLGRVDEADEQLALGRIGFEADDVMNRIAVYFFRQLSRS
jgi:hypothetical protein